MIGAGTATLIPKLSRMSVLALYANWAEYGWPVTDIGALPDPEVLIVLRRPPRLCFDLSAWAEDRALQGWNPSAGSGAGMRGGEVGRPFAFMLAGKR